MKLKLNLVGGDEVIVDSDDIDKDVYTGGYWRFIVGDKSYDVYSTEEIDE